MRPTTYGSTYRQNPYLYLAQGGSKRPFTRQEKECVAPPLMEGEEEEETTVGSSSSSSSSSSSNGAPGSSQRASYSCALGCVPHVATAEECRAVAAKCGRYGVAFYVLGKHNYFEFAEEGLVGFEKDKRLGCAMIAAVTFPCPQEGFVQEGVPIDPEVEKLIRNGAPQNRRVYIFVPPSSPVPKTEVTGDIDLFGDLMDNARMVVVWSEEQYGQLRHVLHFEQRMMRWRFLTFSFHNIEVSGWLSLNLRDCLYVNDIKSTYYRIDGRVGQLAYQNGDYLSVRNSAISHVWAVYELFMKVALSPLHHFKYQRKIRKAENTKITTHADMTAQLTRILYKAAHYLRSHVPLDPSEDDSKTEARTSPTAPIPNVCAEHIQLLPARGAKKGSVKKEPVKKEALKAETPKKESFKMPTVSAPSYRPLGVPVGVGARTGAGGKGSRNGPIKD